MRPAVNDRDARSIVWAVWTGMLVLLVWSFATVVSPVPLAEDWLTVAPLTGHEPNLGRWLWEQNNEHRMPVARLLLLATLQAAGGDNRAGGYLNIALLAATAAGLILFTRHLRGGRTDTADVFFPLALLHFGHSHLLLLPWLVFYVLSIAVILAVGAALFAPGSVASWSAARAAGAGLLLLPLSGFVGLFFLPPVAAYLLYAAWNCRGGSRGWPRHRALAVWLVVAIGGAAALAALYFVGYEHPWWNPPSPGPLPSFKTALKMLSLGFGPAAEFWWEPGVIAVLVVVAAALWEARRALQLGGAARDHAAGAALFLISALGFAFVVGWGRAGYVPQFGMPIRYVILVVPVLVASYWTWVASRSRTGRIAQRALAIAMVILLPFNIAGGHRFFADWYREGMTRVESDLRAGVPIADLAARHQRFLVHWWTPDELARHMHWLREAGIPPFGDRLPRVRE
jgi:hypothetical protein